MPITFRAASAEDADRLLAWRNDPATRQASHHTDPIDRDRHLAWLGRCLADPARTLLVALEDGAPVGTLRVDRGPEAAELSWTVAPEQRGRGVGKRMLRAFLDAHPGRYRAEIKAGNPASVRLVEHVGMALVKTEAGVLHYAITAAAPPPDPA